MSVIRHYSVAGLAKHIGRSKSYVKQLIANRELGYYQERPRAAIMIPETEVEQWLTRLPYNPSVHEVRAARERGEEQASASDQRPR
ncbi:hypothetical protein ACFL59_15435 [Planctomycetota bacterium]